jgi:hypothetical protein
MTNKTDYTDDEWTSVKAQKGMTISLVTVKELLESVPDLAEPGALIPPDLPLPKARGDSARPSPPDLVESVKGESAWAQAIKGEPEE